MDLLDKYSPKYVKNVIGNKIQIKKIIEQLKKVSLDTNEYIIGILGPNGCGKTLISNLIFKELNFNILNISKENYTSKEITVLIKNFCINKTIESYLNPQRKIIFIDNIDIILSIDKHIISTLISCLDIIKKDKILMILTCKNSEEKKLNEFKKDINIIKINYPSIKDTFVYLSNILIEKEKYDITEDKILELVNQYRGSIRDVILNFKDSNETNIEVRNKNIFKDMNIFEIVKKLACGEKYNINDIELILKNDASNISFILYENIIDEIYINRNYKKANKIFIQSYININDSFINSCLIEDVMYSSSDWSLYYLMNLIRIMSVIIEINGIDKKIGFKDLKYRYSQLLSKISHKNIMNKKIQNINSNQFKVEELLNLSDNIIRKKNMKLRLKEKILNSDELNFINTYEKYFTEEI
jgi:hypothetical protein